MFRISYFGFQFRGFGEPYWQTVSSLDLPTRTMAIYGRHTVRQRRGFDDDERAAGQNIPDEQPGPAAQSGRARRAVDGPQGMRAPLFGHAHNAPGTLIASCRRSPALIISRSIAVLRPRYVCGVNARLAVIVKRKERELPPFCKLPGAIPAIRLLVLTDF